MAIPKPILEYNIPITLAADYSGYEFLAHISIRSYDLENKEVAFNFSKCTSFHENLCSPLGALVADLKKRKNKIVFKDLPSSLKSTFETNGFYKVIYTRSPNKSEFNTIEFKKFRLKDTPSFQDYINDQLLSKKEFPHVSVLLKKEIVKSILEIFNNAVTHGGCEFVYTCGHYSTEEMKLKFTISDMGTTIRKNVNNYFQSGSNIDGKAAISWAVVKGNTTKKGMIPGGLGLGLIREFLKLNGGAVQIISSNGFWEEKNGTIFDNSFKNRFLGTIVNMEFNLDDKNSYILASEIDLANIF